LPYGCYIQPGYDSRFHLGDEDTQLGWAHLLRGNYGLAEQHYRRAVEATHQNGSAWIGLAAAYDRLGRGYFLRHRVEARATGQQPDGHGKRTESAEFRLDLQMILLRL
jgi:tetratricopeptide (TPR) repeat protein